MLLEFDAFPGCTLGEPLDDARRLHRAVRWMEDRAAELGTEMRELTLLPPLDLEPVLAERFVLGLDVDALLGVCGQAQARLRPVRHFHGRGQAFDGNPSRAAIEGA